MKCCFLRSRNECLYYDNKPRLIAMLIEKRIYRLVAGLAFTYSTFLNRIGHNITCLLLSCCLEWAVAEAQLNIISFVLRTIVTTTRSAF